MGKIYYPEELRHGQKPAKVLISCSDSRVPGGTIYSEWYFVPGKIFEIRNAGNCFLFNEASLRYAVKHLHVSVVEIMGHSDCGFIKAVIKGNDKDKIIDRDINTFISRLFEGALPTNDVDELAKESVHAQIQLLMNEQYIQERTSSGNLSVIGTYLDFSGGEPRLYLINDNGKRVERQINI